MNEPIRLLYIDDEATWLIIVKTILETNNFQVDTATNGTEGLELFGKNTYDMVLLDAILPGKNGWELIQEFKKQNEWIPVVMYSTELGEEEYARALDLGVRTFISKSDPSQHLPIKLRGEYMHQQKLSRKAEVIQMCPHIYFTPASGKLTIDGEDTFLNDAATQAVIALYRQKEQNLTKKELCEAIWGPHLSSAKEKMLVKLMVEVRKYFKDTPIQIQNKRWVGYRMHINS